MFCSTIIPTIGRRSLTRAVQSVLNQNFTAAEFEIIVVNDSGNPLPNADWQHSFRVRIIETNRRERCVARNTGAALARGHYLHFLDDDDWLLPGALQAIWELAQSNEAAWLSGGCQYVTDDDQVFAEAHIGESGNIFARIMSTGQWLPLQSSFIQADAFFAVGGFHPLILVSQDIHLARQILLNRNFAETLTNVACLLRSSSWQTTTQYAQFMKYYQWGRELNLSQPGVLQRLLSSARTSFWQGRIVRIYLASIGWNLRQRQLFTVASRGVALFVNFLMANWRLLTPSFWHGIVARNFTNVK